MLPSPRPSTIRLSLLALTLLPIKAAKELVLIPLHAAPHQAVAEIDALYDVYLDVIDKWNTDVGNLHPHLLSHIPEH